MKSRKAAFVLLCAMASTAGAQTTQILPKPSGPARVLVLPQPSDALRDALSSRPEVLTVKGAGPGIATLEGLRGDPTVLETLRTEPWDFVVLRGHRTFGRTLVIDGQLRVGDPSGFLHNGRLLLDAVRQAGARPILLVPPRRPGEPASDQATVAWAYERLAREGGALLAPVADAFSKVRRLRPDVALFDPYGDGWSATGAALAAAVVETTITGRPPATQAPSARARAAQASTAETPAPSAAHDLTAETQQLLDRAAWEAVRDLAAQGGRPAAEEPPFPSVPTLAHGEPADGASLRGRWRGPIRLYPWPATLELDIASSSGGLQVSGHVRFEDGRPELTFQASEPELRDGVLSFRNPSDLAGGRTLYRFVSRAGDLDGVAELVTDQHLAYAIGSVELTPIQSDPAVGTR